MKKINVTQKSLGVYDIEFTNFGKDFTVPDYPTNKPFIAHEHDAEDDVTFIIKDNEPSICGENNENPNHFLVEGQRPKKENEEDEEFEGDIIKIQFPSNGSNTIEIDVDEFDPSKREQLRKEREEARKKAEENEKKWEEWREKRRKFKHLDKFQKFIIDNTNLDPKIDQIDIAGHTGWFTGQRMNFLIRTPQRDLRDYGMHFEIFAEDHNNYLLTELEKTLNKLFSITGNRHPLDSYPTGYRDYHEFHVVTYKINNIPKEILDVVYEPLREEDDFWELISQAAKIGNELRREAEAKEKAKKNEEKENE